LKSLSFALAEKQRPKLPSHMTSLDFTTASLGLGLAATIIWLLRRDHLHLSHGLFWLMVAVAAATLGVWRGLIDKAAALTGIAYPPALLLLISVVMLLLKILHTDILNTRIERQVKRLNQRLAMYELEFQREGMKTELTERLDSAEAE
jgi:hypothetical protein